MQIIKYTGTSVSFKYGLKMYCFSKSCRLCFTKDNTLVNMNWSGSDGIPFLDKLGLIAPSLIANPRDYMNWICEQCRKRLKIAYRFVQDCFKSNTVLDEYCKQLTNDDTVQKKCTDSKVSDDIQLTENMIKESIPISVKEECFKDLPAIGDDQYYSETITIDKHELSSVDFNYIKEESSELKQEAYLEVSDCSIEEIMVTECNLDPIENIQIDPLAGTSADIYILSSSDDSNDAKDPAKSCNINSSNSLTKYGSIKSGEGEPINKCFKCGICDKKFAYSYTLKLHERFHRDKHSFNCKICGKNFTQSGNLKQHQRVHSGERPFNCKICGKKFTQRGNLKKHQRLHSERPITYNIRNTTFNHSEAVNNMEGFTTMYDILNAKSGS